ncbi:YheC/YheD family protein [Clostridium thermarum]|uniref:YheC/YheD family endospore coat-associated protein n=1 Tax=Clostridium thermarum TaxID=1716543 RepID=UPI00111DC9F1|nr:YheC/YheD family protein [Clostridium thermarum]
MYDIVAIKLQQSKKAHLILNEYLAEKLNLAKLKRGYVSFGVKKIYVDVDVSGDIRADEIIISQAVAKELYIPEYPIYEIKVKGNEFMLGPCIGILACQKEKDLTKRMLKEMALYVMDYGRIHGAVIAFSLEKVNKDNHTIEGYCYNPQKESWENGVFPYPLSIYRRSRLSDEWENHFLPLIGDTIFNNYSFDKWYMHKWFSKEREIAEHIPRTIVYRQKKDLYDMLERYGVVYVKPIWGMKGFGVIRVSKEDEKLRFRYREDGSNIDFELEEEREIDETLEKLFSPGDCIIQQGLELISYDGGLVDFRCVMQKNETRKWECSSIIARVGAKESVVSNISSGGSALPAMDLIRAALASSHLEVFNIKEELISLCMKVCNTLDSYGYNFGTLGLDIGVDKNKKIWLIEVNNRRPHPAIALRASDIQAYYTILTAPLRYAKALAGFGSKEEEKDAL